MALPNNAPSTARANLPASQSLQSMGLRSTHNALLISGNQNTPTFGGLGDWFERMSVRRRVRQEYYANLALMNDLRRSMGQPQQAADPAEIERQVQERLQQRQARRERHAEAAKAAAQNAPTTPPTPSDPIITRRGCLGFGVFTALCAGIAALQFALKDKDPQYGLILRTKNLIPSPINFNQPTTLQSGIGGSSLVSPHGRDVLLDGVFTQQPVLYDSVSSESPHTFVVTRQDPQTRQLIRTVYAEPITMTHRDGSVQTLLAVGQFSRAQLQQGRVEPSAVTFIYPGHNGLTLMAQPTIRINDKAAEDQIARGGKFDGKELADAPVTVERVPQLLQWNAQGQGSIRPAQQVPDVLRLTDEKSLRQITLPKSTPPKGSPPERWEVKPLSPLYKNPERIPASLQPKHPQVGINLKP